MVRVSIWFSPGSGIGVSTNWKSSSTGNAPGGVRAESHCLFMLCGLHIYVPPGQLGAAQFFLLPINNGGMGDLSQSPQVQEEVGQRKCLATNLLPLTGQVKGRGEGRSPQPWRLATHI
jgi:hypothetical protein